MTAYELLDKLGGVIQSNKARVVVDGQSVVIGVFDGPELVLTDAGRELAAKYAQAAKPAPQAPAQVTARKAKAPVVDSGATGLST